MPKLRRDLRPHLLRPRGRPARGDPPARRTAGPLAAARAGRSATTYIDDDRSAYSRQGPPGIPADARRHPRRVGRCGPRLPPRPTPPPAAGARGVLRGLRRRRACADLASVSGDIDLANHDGRFLARIMGAVAAQGVRRQEPPHHAASTRRWPRPGRPIGGGTRPFGYRDDSGPVDPAEAAAVREAAAPRPRRRQPPRRSRPTGTSAASRPSAGRPWTIQVLRRMLVSARDCRASASTTARSSRPATGSRSSPPTETAALRAILDDRDPRARAGPSAATSCRAASCAAAVCDAALVARPRADGDPPLRLRQGSGPARLRQDRDPRRAGRGLHRRGRPVPPRHARARGRPRRVRPARRPTADASRPRRATGHSSRSSPRAYGERAHHRSPSTSPPGSRSRPGSRRPSGRLARLTRTAAIDPYVGDGRRPPRRLGRPAAHPSAGDRRRGPRPGRSIRPAVPGRNRFDPDRLEPVWRV